MNFFMMIPSFSMAVSWRPWGSLAHPRHPEFRGDAYHRRMDHTRFVELAKAEARSGRAEGGIPIGAVLVAADGAVLGAGHNRRVQQGSAIRHGETDALERAGRLHASVYASSTMYTTLSPCAMCSGAILLYGIPRVVIGENRTFLGEEDLLRSRGVEVVVLDDAECVAMMQDFIADEPQLWNEDIGEVD
jgi:creatinine deaminase